jgi:hypothetical protein
MTFLVVGIAGLLSVPVAAIGFVRHRPTAVAPLQPRRETYRNIRVLQNDDEVREAARRAYERESFIAHAADRRADRFRQLTRLETRTSA